MGSSFWSSFAAAAAPQIIKGLTGEDGKPKGVFEGYDKETENRFDKYIAKRRQDVEAAYNSYKADFDFWDEAATNLAYAVGEGTDPQNSLTGMEFAAQTLRGMTKSQAKDLMNQFKALREEGTNIRELLGDRLNRNEVTREQRKLTANDVAKMQLGGGFKYQEKPFNLRENQSPIRRLLSDTFGLFKETDEAAATKLMERQRAKIRGGLVDYNKLAGDTSFKEARQSLSLDPSMFGLNDRVSTTFTDSLKMITNEVKTLYIPNTSSNIGNNILNPDKAQAYRIALANASKQAMLNSLSIVDPENMRRVSYDPFAKAGITREEFEDAKLHTNIIKIGTNLVGRQASTYEKYRAGAKVVLGKDYTEENATRIANEYLSTDAFKAYTKGQEEYTAKKEAETQRVESSKEAAEGVGMAVDTTQETPSDKDNNKEEIKNLAVKIDQDTKRLNILQDKKFKSSATNESIKTLSQQIQENKLKLSDLTMGVGSDTDYTKLLEELIAKKEAEEKRVKSSKKAAEGVGMAVDTTQETTSDTDYRAKPLGGLFEKARNRDLWEGDEWDKAASKAEQTKNLTARDARRATTPEARKATTPEARRAEPLVSRKSEQISEEEYNTRLLDTFKEEIRDKEKFRGTTYIPTKGDKPTIGYGFTIGVKPGDTMTKAQAEKRLDTEVKLSLIHI